ncbi:MAG: 16S rRNA (uracil(1498)-N(3))-methyltransferase [Chthoniobacterales bacterium]
MHRFYIPPEKWDPAAFTLTGGEAHHARGVLRLERGDKVVLFNGRGREVTGEIVDLGRGEIHLRKLTESETPPLRCHLALGQAIPKGKNMDLIVQKAVELGAAEIFPLISARTIVDFDENEARRKQTKWQTVVVEAAKQCGQNWLPEVHTPGTIKDFFSSAEAGVAPAALTTRPTWAPLRFDLRLIGSLQPGASHLKKILSDFAGEHQRLPESVLMLIGPEGDFTPAELAVARTHGCRPITLGPIVLRVETAALYCLSVLSYELF